MPIRTISKTGAAAPRDLGVAPGLGGNYWFPEPDESGAPTCSLPEPGRFGGPWLGGTYSFPEPDKSGAPSSKRRKGMPSAFVHAIRAALLAALSAKKGEGADSEGGQGGRLGNRVHFDSSE